MNRTTNMISQSANRAATHAPDEYNQRIREQIEQNVATYAALGPRAIERRLGELDQEWDIERALQTNASALALLGMVKGVISGRRWFLLSGAVMGFLLQHSIQGWCPPIALFRRLGFRTRDEIAQERYALKALRGDFKDMPVLDEQQRKNMGIEQALDAVKK